jgi:7SK snRNA methylphosphate capping enzyme
MEDADREEESSCGKEAFVGMPQVAESVAMQAEARHRAARTHAAPATLKPRLVTVSATTVAVRTSTTDFFREGLPMAVDGSACGTGDIAAADEETTEAPNASCSIACGRQKALYLLRHDGAASGQAVRDVETEKEVAAAQMVAETVAKGETTVTPIAHEREAPAGTANASVDSLATSPVPRGIPPAGSPNKQKNLKRKYSTALPTGTRGRGVAQSRRLRLDTGRPPRNFCEVGTHHGSYGAYYGRRVDDRVPLLHPRWTERAGARVLDLGCNDGSVALRVARERAPVAVVGVDIDGGLVARARDQLQALLHDAKSNNIADPGSGDCGEVGGIDSSTVRGTAPVLFENVCFREEDFAAEQETKTASEKESFDVVLMLSVTKWVHLHGGDSALKRFFTRARDCLRPGGVLVLEPQPSISYKRALRKIRREAPKASLASTVTAVPPLVRQCDIKLTPDMFPDFLLSAEGGFESMQVLRDVRESGQPFNRPVLAFFKAGKCDEQD